MHIWSLQTRRAIATLDGHGGQCVIWLQTLPQGQQLLRYVSVAVPKEPGVQPPLAAQLPHPQQQNRV